MKLGRITALAASGTMLVGALAGVGVIGSGTASAASESFLCTDSAADGGSPVCAYANGSGALIAMRTTANVSMTHWIYPGAGEPAAEIEQAGTAGAGLCMEVDSSAADEVIEATCNDASYQTWENEYVDATSRTIFRSEWNTSLCLGYDEGTLGLHVTACGNDENWYQQFFAEDSI
ncbi:MAG TPA: hypothetical protein VG142_06790 [Trebonia sp.]|jgi:hypothetical protein|nr:hypothetical protein [Trebonia sp.]